MKITVISTDNPAHVETVIDPVKLQDSDSMDLVSIYHGLIYNITEDNNTIRYIINGEETVSNIKPGYYQSSSDIFDAIQACVEEKGLEKVIQFLSKDNLRYIKMTIGTFIVGDDTPFSIILPNMTKNIRSYVLNTIFVTRRVVNGFLCNAQRLFYMSSICLRVLIKYTYSALFYCITISMLYIYIYIYRLHI